MTNPKPIVVPSIEKMLEKMLIWAIPLALAIFVIFNFDFDFDLKTIIVFLFFYIGIVSMVIINIIRKDNNETTEEIIHMIELFSYRPSSTGGIERVYDNQNELMKNYIKLVKNARFEVSILGGSLFPFFLFHDFESSTINAVKNGVKFRILITDISFDQIENKSGKEQYINIWKKMIIDNMLINDEIELRAYKGLPNLFLLMVDDTMFFAPYIDFSSYLDSPYFETDSKKSDIYLAYRRLFDSIWANSSECKYI